MVDTGSEVSTVNENTWNDLLKVPSTKILTSFELNQLGLPSHLTMANNKSIPSKAMLVSSFSILPPQSSPLMFNDIVLFLLPGSSNSILGMDIILESDTLKLIHELMKNALKENSIDDINVFRDFNVSTLSNNQINLIESSFDTSKLIDSSFPLKEELSQILLEKKDLFSTKLTNRSLQVPPMPIELIPHEILPKQDRRVLSVDKSRILEDTIQELLSLGIIAPCYDPPTVCNSVLVCQNGKWRVCQDFTWLNKFTKPNHFPLPLISSFKEIFVNNRYFAKLDLVKGFHQMKLDPASQKLTSFYGNNNMVYQYLYVPFGLMNAPAYFQAAITQILGDSFGRNSFCYIDDILIFAKTPEEFLEACREVLDKLDKGGATLSSMKCCFGSSEIEYLGHIFDGTKYSLNKDRYKEIADFDIPKTVKDLRSFMGCASAFRDFIPNYSKFESHLSPLAATVNQSRTKIMLNPEQLDAFHQLKSAISEAEFLYLPDPNLPYYLFTDASKQGFGSMLAQKRPDLPPHPTLKIPNNPDLVPVGLLSKTFRGPELRWSTYEQELYAIVASFKKWDRIIGSSKIQVNTDHRNLCYLLSTPSPKVERWFIFLSFFQIHWNWVPGEINFVADYFSRSTSPPVSEQEIKLRNSFLIKKSINALTFSKETPTATISDYEENIEEISRVGPSAYDVIRTVHNDLYGHPSALNTLKMLKEKNLQWNNMLKHITSYIKSCPICQFNQRSDNIIYTSKLSTEYPFHILSADVLDFYVDGELQHIIVFVDNFSGFTELSWLPSVSTDDVVFAFLSKIYAVHGLPETFHSDNAKYFNNHFIKSLSNYLGYNVSFSIANHSPSNGIAERKISSVLQLLRKLFTTKKFSNYKIQLPVIQRHLNFTYSKIIENFPVLLLYGNRIFNKPHDFLNKESSISLSPDKNYSLYIDEISSSIDTLILHSYMARIKEQKRKHKQFSKYRSAPNFDYKPGDLVIVPRKIFKSPRSKLLSHYSGPYEVLNSTDSKITLVNAPTGCTFSAHKAECRPFYFDENRLRTDFPELMDSFMSDESFLVEKILGHYGSLAPRNLNNAQFFVKWVGYVDDENSWIPYENAKDLTLLKEYLKNPSLQTHMIPDDV